MPLLLTFVFILPFLWLLVALHCKCCFDCLLILTVLPPPPPPPLPQPPCCLQTLATRFLCFPSFLVALGADAGPHQGAWPGVGSLLCLTPTSNAPTPWVPVPFAVSCWYKWSSEANCFRSKMSLSKGNLARSMYLADGFFQLVKYSWRTSLICWCGQKKNHIQKEIQKGGGVRAFTPPINLCPSSEFIFRLYKNAA